MKLFLLLLRFHLLTLWHQRGQIYHGWAFFALIVMCFPIGMASELNLLREVSAASLWIALIISSLIPVHLIFDEDYRDGTLELFVHKQLMIEWVVLARVFSQCLLQPLPLAVLGGGLLWLTGYAGDLGALMLTMLLAGICTISLATLGAALTLGLRQRGGLLYVLLLPLLVPVLIFGGMVSGGGNTSQAIMALGGLVCLTVPLSIILSAFCLKAAVK